MSGQQFTSRDEKPYCAECFGKLLAESNSCSKPGTGKPTLFINYMRFLNAACHRAQIVSLPNFDISNCPTVGVFMKKELPEKQIKSFLQQVFCGEMKLIKKS